MRKAGSPTERKTCPSCGAPVVSEICAYCGTATGLHTDAADMEYPVMECKEAVINFWSTVFPLIFAVAFGGAGLIALVIAIKIDTNGVLLLTGIPFLLIGIVASVLVLRTVLCYAKVKKHGKRIQAEVYGYLDDNVMLNHQPSQIVKLLVQTPNGPRFILYQLRSTIKPYGINDCIDVLVYKNYFLICKNEDVAEW